MVKNLPANAGDIRDMGSIPGSKRSPGEGNDNPPQYAAWDAPWTEEPGKIQFIESQKSRTPLSDRAAQQKQHKYPMEE